MAINQTRPDSWTIGILWVFLWGILAAGELKSQVPTSPFDPLYGQEAAAIKESVHCFTDRSVYIVGEDLCFSAWIRQGVLPEARKSFTRSSWSRVLYAELVGPDGRRIWAGKYLIDQGHVEGQFPIPGNLPSGTYFLRSYTRWMRNWDPSIYNYVALRIINPHDPEVQAPLPPAERSFSWTDRKGSAHQIRILGPQKALSSEDSLRFELDIEPYRGEMPIRGCLSITSAAVSPEDLSLSGAAGDFHLEFLPDLYGPSLSGILKAGGDSVQNLGGSRVHLTLMGDAPVYLVAKADSGGRFTVGLPARTGKMEFLVQAEGPVHKPLEVQIDQDFDSRKLQLQAPPFRLSAIEEEVALAMVQKQQLAEIYGDTAQLAKAENDSLLHHWSAPSDFPFYGKAMTSVLMDDYVLLPTLREVFLNLVPTVTPIKRRKQAMLSIFSQNPGLSLYPPLLLVDQVPVFDIERFLSISPARICRIDVIEDVYVKGDMRFGGLVNLQSMDRDMAGMDLPVHSFFFDYQGMCDPRTIPGNQADPRRPDTRNTLLWEPDLNLSRAHRKKIVLKAPNLPGAYAIVFRAIGPDGEFIRSAFSFRVE